MSLGERKCIYCPVVFKIRKRYPNQLTCLNPECKTKAKREAGVKGGRARAAALSSCKYKGRTASLVIMDDVEVVLSVGIDAAKAKEARGREMREKYYRMMGRL